MMAVKEREHISATVSRPTLVVAFGVWSQSKREANGLPSLARALCSDAIEEVFNVNPTSFDEWWLRNSYRYMKGMTEIDRRRARVLTRSFMADVALGRVDV